jgi:1-acyl-sn-glycerol-3-phosphate acyltransferase
MKKSATMVWCSRVYARRAIRTRFDGFFISGLERARAQVDKGPVLFSPNHMSWWDTFFLVLLDEALGTDGYGLMDQNNLARLPFFGGFGVLPIDTLGGPSTRGQLRVAKQMLDATPDARRALWIFPQGTQRPHHLRPLQFKGGVRLLASASVPVVPVAMALLFRERPEPSLFVHFGEAIDGADVAMRGGVERVEAAVVRGLETIDANYASLDGFVALIPPQSAATPETGLGTRLLRLVSRRDGRAERESKS